LLEHPTPATRLAAISRFTPTEAFDLIWVKEVKFIESPFNLTAAAM
jgi:hypothetical protein